MEKSGYIIGFYFAQDAIIHCAYDTDTKQFSDIGRLDEVIEDGNECLIEAAKIIAEAYAGKGKPILGIGLAVPSAIIELKKDEPDYGKLGSPYGPRKWQDFNARDVMNNELLLQGVTLANENCIAIISQVGATARGHFERSLREASDAGKASDARNHNYIYIVADHGIGIASISRGWLLHGNSVPNIGHSLVTPLEPSAPKPCKAHPLRNCLNSYASLDAIYERWPELGGDFSNCQDPNKLALVANYLAQAISNLVLFMSPTCIIMGGRISDNERFLEHFRAQLEFMLQPHVDYKDTKYDPFDDLDEFIKHQDDKNDGVRGAVFPVERWINPAIGITQDIKR